MKVIQEWEEGGIYRKEGRKEDVGELTIWLSRRVGIRFVSGSTPVC